MSNKVHVTTKAERSNATRAAEQPFYSRDLVKDAVQGQPITDWYLDQDQRGGMEGCI